MQMDPSDVRVASHPNYPKYEPLLSPGWINGRKVDNSDTQYSFFRGNIPYMLALLVAHPLLRRVYNKLVPVRSALRTPIQTGDSRLEQRLSFDFGFALLFVSVLHGFSALKILSILYLNYSIAKRLPHNFIVPVTWAFNISTLFANELCAGYPYHTLLSFVPIIGTSDVTQSFAATIDGIGGLVSRWEVLFNITVLRLVSFNIDYRWSLDQPRSVSLEVRALPGLSIPVLNVTRRNR